MLNTTELKDALGSLEESKVLSILQDFMDGKPTEAEAQQAITACQEGMAVVSDHFDKGDYYIGDLMYAGEILTQAVNILKPAFGGKSAQAVGKIVLGTVHDDVHDIGKNIFRSMAEAAGFEVYDLGIDVPVDTFVDKVREVQPQIVGLSGVLTMAIQSMKDTVAGLDRAGLRDGVKVTIGGACASKEAMDVSGADAWSTNAADTVTTCLAWVQ